MEHEVGQPISSRTSADLGVYPSALSESPATKVCRDPIFSLN